MDSTGRGSGEKPHGLSKFVRRASRVLKPSSKRNSMASESGPATGEEPSIATATASSSAAAPPKPKTPAVAPAAASATPNVSRAPGPAASPLVPKRSNVQSVSAPRRNMNPQIELIRSTPTSAAAHFRLQEDKARALFAKYNLALEPGEWASAKGTKEREWVEKQVRIRVHRTCHRCRTSFGADKVCSKCQHTRCKKCPRFPDKVKDQKDKEKARVLVDSDPKYQAAPQKAKIVPTMVSKGGQEMVRKTPQHRVRRTCHKCNMLFAGKSTECAGCKHVRCPKCPREPPKTKKWPDGYPGDQEETFPLVERTLKQIRHRVRWQCHECERYFMEKECTCSGCKHERCDKCTRTPPKKIKPEPDPAILRSLEEKMARTQLSPAA